MVEQYETARPDSCRPGGVFNYLQVWRTGARCSANASRQGEVLLSDDSALVRIGNGAMPAAWHRAWGDLTE
jgi:hypothetical protein